MKLIRNGQELEVCHSHFEVQPGDIMEVKPDLWVIATDVKVDARGRQIDVMLYKDSRPRDINGLDTPPPVKWGLKLLANIAGVKYR